MYVNTNGKLTLGVILFDLKNIVEYNIEDLSGKGHLFYNCITFLSRSLDLFEKPGECTLFLIFLFNNCKFD